MFTTFGKLLKDNIVTHSEWIFKFSKGIESFVKVLIAMYLTNTARKAFAFKTPSNVMDFALFLQFPLCVTQGKGGKEGWDF